jgi:PIN domain nuclease of toxin-antitoxin system
LRLLLDTCAFLWLANDDPALSPVALAALTTEENDLFLSSLSAAEIAIKYGLGRLGAC